MPDPVRGKVKVKITIKEKNPRTNICKNLAL